MNPTENYFKISQVLYNKTQMIRPGQVLVALIKQQGDVLAQWARTPEWMKEETPPLAFMPDVKRIARALDASELSIWFTISRLEKLCLVAKQKVGKKVLIIIDFVNIDQELKELDKTLEVTT